MLFWYFDWKGIRSTGMEKGLLHKQMAESRLVEYKEETIKDELSAAL
ncbi:MAG: hypothetical protein IJA10_08800 [Lachnospiraceae bacterium]|nr:hypothetical protein [Lachnospiraceae bacterium]